MREKGRRVKAGHAPIFRASHYESYLPRSTLDKYLAPVDLGYLNPASGAKDEYVTPSVPSGISPKRRRLPTLPLEAYGLREVSGRQKRAPQPPEPIARKPNREIKDDSEAFSQSTAKPGAGRTGTGLRGAGARSADFGPAPPVPPINPLLVKSSSEDGRTVRGPGGGPRGLMAIKNGNALGPASTGGAKTHRRRLQTMRKAKGLPPQSDEEMSPFLVAFQESLGIALAKKQQREMVTDALFKHIFNNRSLQVTELADALTCISECLPPQLMLVSAGFFVQQKFYFSAIKAVHSVPDLLTALLQEIVHCIGYNEEEADPEELALSWRWNRVDKDAFAIQFQNLQIIQEYIATRDQLLRIPRDSFFPIARIERNTLLKLANEFISQMVTAAQVAAAEEARLEEEKLKAEWEEMVRQEEERIAKIEEVWLAEYEELKKEAEATLSGEALETYLKEKKQKEEIRRKALRQAAMNRLGWKEGAGPIDRQRPWATGAGWVKGPGDPGMVEIAEGVWISDEEAQALKDLEEQARREEEERKEREAFCKVWAAEVMEAAAERAEKELEEEEKERVAEARAAAAQHAAETALRKLEEAKLEAERASKEAEEAEKAADEAAWKAQEMEWDMQAEGEDSLEAVYKLQKAKEQLEATARLAKVAKAAAMSKMSKISELQRAADVAVNKAAAHKKAREKAKAKKEKLEAKERKRAEAMARALANGEEYMSDDSDDESEASSEGHEFVGLPDPEHDAKKAALAEARAAVKAATMKVEVVTAAYESACEAVRLAPEGRKVAEAALAEARRVKAGAKPAEGATGPVKGIDPSEIELEDLEDAFELAKVKQVGTQHALVDALQLRKDAEEELRASWEVETEAAHAVLEIAEALRSAARRKLNNTTEAVIAAVQTVAAFEEALAAKEDEKQAQWEQQVAAAAGLSGDGEGSNDGGAAKKAMRVAFEDTGTAGGQDSPGDTPESGARRRSLLDDLGDVPHDDSSEEDNAPNDNLDDLDDMDLEMEYDNVKEMLKDAEESRLDAFGELSWWSNHVTEAMKAEMELSAAHMESSKDMHEAAHQLVWDAAEAEEVAEESMHMAKWNIMEAKEAAVAAQAVLKWAETPEEEREAEAEAAAKAAAKAGRRGQKEEVVDPRARDEEPSDLRTLTARAAAVKRAPSEDEEKETKKKKKKKGGKKKKKKKDKKGEEEEEQEEENHEEAGSEEAEPEEQAIKTIPDMRIDVAIAEADLKSAEELLPVTEMEVEEAKAALVRAIEYRKLNSELLAAALEVKSESAEQREEKNEQQWQEILMDMQAAMQELDRVTEACEEAAAAMTEATESNPEGHHYLLIARVKALEMVKSKANEAVKQANEAMQITNELISLNEDSTSSTLVRTRSFMPALIQEWDEGEEEQALNTARKERNNADNAVTRGRVLLGKMIEQYQAGLDRCSAASIAVAEAEDRGIEVRKIVEESRKPPEEDEAAKDDKAQEQDRQVLEKKQKGGEEGEGEEGDEEEEEEEEKQETDYEKGMRKKREKEEARIAAELELALELVEEVEAAEEAKEKIVVKYADAVKSLRYRERAAIHAARDEAAAAVAWFTSSEEAIEVAKKNLVKEDRSGKMARREMRKLTSALEDAEERMNEVMGSEEVPLEEQDEAEELAHELDNKVQDAMKVVVEAENRKAAATKVRDDAKQFLVESLLQRISRSEERRDEAEIAWKSAIEQLQDGLRGEDGAEANLEVAKEAFEEANQKALEKAAAAAAGAQARAGDGKTVEVEPEALPLAVTARMAAAEAAHEWAQEVVARGNETVMRANKIMQECEEVEAETRQRHFRELPENQPKKKVSLIDPLMQAVLNAEENQKKMEETVKEAKERLVEILEFEREKLRDFIAADEKLGEAMDDDPKQEKQHLELKEALEMAREELTAAEERSSVAWAEVCEAEEEEAGARMEVEEAMETQALDAEENLENAKENLLDAEDSHFATMLALTEAERAVEIATESRVWATVNKARGVMEGAQMAAIKTEKALRFANMERDKTNNKLDGIVEDQFFRGEAHKQHADILLKITRRHIRPVKELSDEINTHYFKVGNALTRAEDEAAARGEPGLPFHGKNATLRGAEESRQRIQATLDKYQERVAKAEEFRAKCELIKENAQKRLDKLREPEVKKERKRLKTDEERKREEEQRKAAKATEMARREEIARRKREEEERVAAEIREKEERLARADAERKEITGRIAEEKRMHHEMLAEKRKDLHEQAAEHAVQDGAKATELAQKRKAEAEAERQALEARMLRLQNSKLDAEPVELPSEEELLQKPAEVKEQVMAKAEAKPEAGGGEARPDSVDEIQQMVMKRQAEEKKRLQEKIAAKKQMLTDMKAAKMKEMEVASMGGIPEHLKSKQTGEPGVTAPKEEALKEQAQKQKLDNVEMQRRVETERQRLASEKAKMEAARQKQMEDNTSYLGAVQLDPTTAEGPGGGAATGVAALAEEPVVNAVEPAVEAYVVPEDVTTMAPSAAMGDDDAAAAAGASAAGAEQQGGSDKDLSQSGPMNMVEKMQQLEEERRRRIAAGTLHELPPEPTQQEASAAALAALTAALEQQREEQNRYIAMERQAMRDMIDLERSAMEENLEAEKADLLRRMDERQEAQEKAQFEKVRLEQEIAQTLQEFQQTLLETQRMTETLSEQQSKQSATTESLNRSSGGGSSSEPSAQELLSAPMQFRQQFGPLDPPSRRHTVARAPPDVTVESQNAQMDADDGEDDDPPTHDEIVEYAQYLGMDPVADVDLLYIAEWALTAPLPEGWSEHLDQDGNEFYYNMLSGVSTYEHPLDDQYRAYYRNLKQTAAAAAAVTAAAS